MNKEDLFWKIFLVTCYIIASSFFWIGEFYLLINIWSIKTLLLAIFILVLLFLPILLILNIKYYKKILILFFISIFWIFLLWFWKNSWIDKVEWWIYELVCINNCSEYNWSLFNTVSEKELLNMWFDASWLLWMSKKQILSFKDSVLKLNNSIKINLASQIPDSLINKTNFQKYFLYKPDKIKQNKVIIFLHWSAWWFKYYQKLFKNFLDKNGIIMASPNYWWGNWEQLWWQELVYKTYNDLVNKKLINKNSEIILVWASNWGRWLTRLISQDNKNLFKKIVFISGVIEKSVTDLEEFKNNIKNKQVLVIHWTEDKQVDYYFVNKFLEEFKDNNIEREIFFWEDWNHFILWTKVWIIKEKIENFINK